MAEVLGTGKQRAGKNSRVSVGADDLTMAKWSVDSKADMGDTTNFESGGFDEGITEILSADISFGGNWDAGDNPFDDPPGLYPRDNLPDVSFYENTTDDVGWDFEFVRIRSARNGAEVRGLVTFEVSGSNQGEFASPTGSV